MSIICFEYPGTGPNHLLINLSLQVNRYPGNHQVFEEYLRHEKETLWQISRINYPGGNPANAENIEL